MDNMHIDEGGEGQGGSSDEDGRFINLRALRLRGRYWKSDPLRMYMLIINNETPVGASMKFTPQITKAKYDKLPK